MENGTVVVEIEDNGKGMDEKTQKQIFDHSSPRNGQGRDGPRSGHRIQDHRRARWNHFRKKRTGRGNEVHHKDPLRVRKQGGRLMKRVLIVDDDSAVTNYFMVFLMQTEDLSPWW